MLCSVTEGKLWRVTDDKLWRVTEFLLWKLNNNPYVTLHNIYYGVLHNISSVALLNKSYVTKKFTEFSENLKNFNYSLYSDNGGLIYGNGSGRTRGGGRGSYTSTHQPHPVYPLLISLQISPYSSISPHSPTTTLPRVSYLHISPYISLFRHFRLNIMFFRNNYYVHSNKA